MLISAADYHIKYNLKSTESPVTTDRLPSAGTNWNTLTYQRFNLKKERSAEKDKEARQSHTFSDGISGLSPNHFLISSIIYCWSNPLRLWSDSLTMYYNHVKYIQFLDCSDRSGYNDSRVSNTALQVGDSRRGTTPNTHDTDIMSQIWKEVARPRTKRIPSRNGNPASRKRSMRSPTWTNSIIIRCCWRAGLSGHLEMSHNRS